jgi:hypothetical protein
MGAAALVAGAGAGGHDAGEPDHVLHLPRIGQGLVGPGLGLGEVHARGALLQLRQLRERRVQLRVVAHNADAARHQRA